MRPLGAHCRRGLGTLWDAAVTVTLQASISPPQPGCTARWTWASGSARRRRSPESPARDPSVRRAPAPAPDATSR
jgi:hypothetical protein